MRMWRIPAREVLENLDSVLAGIKEQLKAAEAAVK